VIAHRWALLACAGVVIRTRQHERIDIGLAQSRRSAFL
jgi:hypothetical protein